jgi:osmoprotectant transport system permease protein
MIVRASIRCCLLLAACCACISTARAAPLQIGSKTFTESHVLAEITAQLLEANNIPVQRRLGLGGTLVAFEALKAGDIDIYPEYTGTLGQAVFQQPGMQRSALLNSLSAQQLAPAAWLGFNNSYAIALGESTARSLAISTISELAAHPDLELAFSHEFLQRGDGWPALSRHYRLPQQPRGIEHALAYRAIESGMLQGTDAYTTDGELDAFRLRLLEDDRGFFPQYDAILLARSDLPAAAAAVLARLQGVIDEPAMRGMNRRVANEGADPASVAGDFLRERGLVYGKAMAGRAWYNSVLDNTATHLKLTLSALLLACLFAIPTALLLARHEKIARGLLYISGLLQTIPALALLALLIPLVGLGQTPAIIALFLYSLLPIVRNTLTGIFSIDPLLREVAEGIGLTPRQQLLRVELPLAAPTILAGVKTAAIISIGTATLAAFVGAGGLGEPIITGLTLNDNRLILQGAIPAALLAILVELLFELVERGLIPAHLRS